MRPRHVPLILPILFALIAFGFATLVPAACGSPVATTASPNQVSTAPTASASGASMRPAPTSAAPEVGQTDTEWGRIWDDVPAGFPTFPGSTATDDVSAEPASARYVVADSDAREIAAWLQTALETATYSTEALSGPLEDGGFVLDSVGDAGCRIETRVAPLGGMTLVTVRYGAACPTG